MKTGYAAIGGSIRTRATMNRRKTGEPVQAELTADARKGLP